MKKVLMTLILIFVSWPVYGASIPLPDKSKDENLQAMIKETLPKFQTMTYKAKNFQMPVNIYLPEGYPGDRTYPLLIFIADGSVVGKGPDAPLRQGYGGIIWATKKAQAAHKCIIAVPQYPELILDDHSGYSMTNYIDHTENLIRSLIASFRVDPDRVYATGQSMGCMTFLVLASRQPDLFAAEIFVSGQWDIRALTGLKSQKFFYITAEGDVKASTGQKALIKMFESNHVPFTQAMGWDAKMSQDDYTRAMNTILMGKPSANFIQFRLGTVLDEGVKIGSPEHMFSFDYAYKIDALREWLFRQNRKDKKAR